MLCVGQRGVQRGAEHNVLAGGIRMCLSFHRPRPQNRAIKNGDSDPNFKDCGLSHTLPLGTERGVHACSWRANRDVDVWR